MQTGSDSIELLTALTERDLRFRSDAKVTEHAIAPVDTALLDAYAAIDRKALRHYRLERIREQLRAQQERDMWHAVGHEIMSPLQSLMVLYGPDDPGHRYVQRMQQAIHVLYGTASPAEARTPIDQRHPLAAHKVFPAIGVRGVQVSARVRAALEGAQRRRVVGNHHRWAVK